jgi:NADPH:quinone reductase-like Zn-dependent oxidoreductase
MRPLGTISTYASVRRAFGWTGGKGAWAAVDPIGGDIAQKITQSLRDDGTLLVYSSMAGMTSNVGIPDLLYRGVKVNSRPYLC